MIDQDAAQEDAQFKAANDIYSLYFIGWLLGFLAFIIGAVWAAWKVRQAQGLVASHFQFQQSVAIQGIVVLLVAVAVNLLWYWLFAGHLSTLVMVLTIAAYIWWWLARCIAAYRILNQQQAIADPKTWGKPRAEYLQEDKV